MLKGMLNLMGLWCDSAWLFICSYAMFLPPLLSLLQVLVYKRKASCLHGNCADLGIFVPPTVVMACQNDTPPDPSPSLNCSSFLKHLLNREMDTGGWKIASKYTVQALQEQFVRSPQPTGCKERGGGKYT